MLPEVAADVELRTFRMAEVRVEGGDGDPVIVGRAAVYNQPSGDLGFTETIEPGFFENVLQDDTRALFNHDPNFVLGRRPAGTLSIHDSRSALEVRIRTPKTAVIDELVLEPMRRGDIDQMSFAFSVRSGGDAWHEEAGKLHRTLKRGGCSRLYDVSVVTYPAYPQTSAQVRSKVSELRAQGVHTVKKNPRELRSQREELEQKLASLNGEARDQALQEIGRLSAEIDQLEGAANAAGERASRDFLGATGYRQRRDGSMETTELEAEDEDGFDGSGRPAPAMRKLRMGSDEMRAMGHFIRTGDQGPLWDLRASNNTIMNETTAADGGAAVPTGHFRGIIARRDELMLANQLGVRRIPGRGKTVNVVYDNEADGEFVQTAEQDDAHAQTYDRDAPAIDTAAMTLVKYTKKVELGEEVLDDEDSNLMEFITDFVGRGMAKGHNNLLLTEVAANGTCLKTFAAAAAIAALEPEAIVYQTGLGPYLEDDASVGWVMRSPTYGAIVSLTGNPRLYADGDSSARPRRLLGYPVRWSNKAAAIAANAKSVYFGNWNYVGLREAPAFRVIRDDISVDGLVILKYSYRCVYKVLQVAAVGYGVHPSA